MSNLLSDESYIQLTIELAKKGTGNVSPNPLVGAVIVKSGKIIGMGYHSKFGEKHAEIDAFNNCSESAENATLYVNLEPCSHYGKTPPCTDTIIANKIKKVVIGTLDPNPLVSGKGVEKLKNAGIEIVLGVLEKECLELNKFFFKYISAKLPYVNIKIAQTLDSKIADDKFRSKWITSAEARTYVHEQRSKYDAVLIGSNTVRVDNPELSVRLLDGRNPFRVILNKDLDLDLNKKIFNLEDGKTIIICSEKYIDKKNKIEKYTNHGIKILYVKESKSCKLKLKSILKELYKYGISSVIVEGGSSVFSSFVKKGLYDEINVFVSPKILGNGLSPLKSLGIKKLSNAISLKLHKVSTLGDDVLLTYYKGK